MDYLSKSYTSASFTTNQTANASFVLHNAIWDPHFTTERWQKDNQLSKLTQFIILLSAQICYIYFNRIDIMSNYDELSFLLLNQRCNCVHTLAYHERPLRRSICLTRCTSLGASTQPLFFGLLALWPIFVQKFEQLSGCKNISMKKTNRYKHNNQNIKIVPINIHYWTLSLHTTQQLNQYP